MTSLEKAAQEAAGNWQHFECFAWFERPKLKNPRDWAIVYTQSRDSEALERSNAEVIDENLRQFMEEPDPDVVPERHTHWAVGWLDGYRIRVYRNGGISDAFKTWHALQQRIEEYPILDEERYSELAQEEYYDEA